MDRQDPRAVPSIDWKSSIFHLPCSKTKVNLKSAIAGEKKSFTPWARMTRRRLSP